MRCRRDRPGGRIIQPGGDARAKSVDLRHANVWEGGLLDG